MVTGIIVVPAFPESVPGLIWSFLSVAKMNSPSAHISTRIACVILIVMGSFQKATVAIEVVGLEDTGDGESFEGKSDFLKHTNVTLEGFNLVRLSSTEFVF